jgi:hypothetical protein
VTAVLVHIDLDGDSPDASSLVALAAGRQVASSWGATLYAALVVHEPFSNASSDSTVRVVQSARLPRLEAVQMRLARAGADKILIALTDTAVAPLWACVGAAWQGVLDHLRPRVVLFGADSPSAHELGPRTGARIGARLLLRARTAGGDEIELRDRDGGYVRAGDSGAVVALIGVAEPAGRGDDDIDLLVLATPGGGDSRIEVDGSQAASVEDAVGALVALGDDAASRADVVAEARHLAERLGAQLVGGPAAMRAGAIPATAVVDRSTPLAPELCVTVGSAQVELAGATRLVKIGAPASKIADGALANVAGLGELVQRLGGR